jgi:hypothetical protein
MYLAAGFRKAAFLWRVWERDYEQSPDDWNVFILRLQYGKWVRKWQLTVRWDEPAWFTNVRLCFYRTIDDKREGWELQGPVRRLY